MEITPKASLAVAAGVLFNLYASIAFTTPLNLTPYEWTLLRLFLEIAHALPVENTIMKTLRISHILAVIISFSVVFLFKNWILNNFNEYIFLFF